MNCVRIKSLACRVHCQSRQFDRHCFRRCAMKTTRTTMKMRIRRWANSNRLTSWKWERGGSSRAILSILRYENLIERDTFIRIKESFFSHYFFRTRFPQLAVIFSNRHSIKSFQMTNEIGAFDVFLPSTLPSVQLRRSFDVFVTKPSQTHLIIIIVSFRVHFDVVSVKNLRH